MGFRRLAATPQYGGCGRRAAMVPRRGGASAHPTNNYTFLKICPQKKPAGARDDDSDDNDNDPGGNDDDNGNNHNTS